jgi:hypothetical protein
MFLIVELVGSSFLAISCISSTSDALGYPVIQIPGHVVITEVSNYTSLGVQTFTVVGCNSDRVGTLNTMQFKDLSKHLQEQVNTLRL